MINEMEKDVARVLISEEQIRQRVKEMGAQISEDYAGKDVVLLCILKGAVQFFSDLSRQMTCNLEMDFMSISSYAHLRHSAHFKGHGSFHNRPPCAYS